MVQERHTVLGSKMQQHHVQPKMYNTKTVCFSGAKGIDRK
jgi:hypothetical protein